MFNKNRLLARSQKILFSSKCYKTYIIKFHLFVTGMNSKGQISRRSVRTNSQYPDALQQISDGIKKYVASTVKESVQSYCLPPRKICVAGPPGPKGIEGPRGQRGPKGTAGVKGEKDIQVLNSFVTALILQPF